MQTALSKKMSNKIQQCPSIAGTSKPVTLVAAAFLSQPQLHRNQAGKAAKHPQLYPQCPGNLSSPIHFTSHVGLINY